MRIYVRVVAGASSNVVTEIVQGEYRVRTTAIAERGCANMAVMRQLAAHFGVAQSCVTIVGGATARVKIIDIDC